MLRRLMDALFPRDTACVLCGALPERGHSVCPACFAACSPCPEGIVNEEGRRIFAAYRYDEHAEKMVAALKFRGLPAIAPDLAARLAPRIPAGYDLLVPVPVSRIRRRERGYNQAAALAESLGAMLGVPVLQALARVRHTRTQIGLNGAERAENVYDAFRARGNAFADKRILLIDDVYTTGSTARECARALGESHPPAAMDIAVFTTTMKEEDYALLSEAQRGEDISVPNQP